MNSFIDVENDPIRERAIACLQHRIGDQKTHIIKSRLKQLGIAFDIEQEANRRFKNFMKETNENEETYYYNDGSEQGVRIVTFKTEILPIDINEHESYSIRYETTYY